MSSGLGCLYPWHFDGGLSPNGPVIGIDYVSGGGPFRFDPFDMVMSDELTAPNVLIAGEPGFGKSSFAKAGAAWLAGAFGVRVCAIDVKGEYRAFAEVLGLDVLELHPDAPAKVNPLSFDGSDDGDRRRKRFIAAIASILLGRALRSVERTVLEYAVDELTAKYEHPGFALLYDLLQEPSETLLADLRKYREELLGETAELRYALRTVVSGAYGGMFAAEHSIQLDATSPGVVLDISRAASEGDETMLHLAMMTGLTALRQLKGSSIRQTVQLADELWQSARTLEAIEYLMKCWKVGRHSGWSNWGMLHRYSDLAAMTADGSETSKMGDVIIKDTSVHVLFRHKSKEDAEQVVDQLALPPRIAEVVRTLKRHRAVVVANGRIAIVEAVLPDVLKRITETNQAMLR